MMPSSATVRAIYRCLLRDAHELQRTPHFNVRRALQLEQWGTGGYVEPLAQKTTSPRVFTSLEEFRKLRDVAFRMKSSSTDITQSIRLGFRQNMQLNDPKVVSAKVDEAIEALSELSEQLLLAQCSSVTVTDGIRIEATSKYLENHSNPASNTYRFTYRVTITNQNEECSVQILGRQYTFESEKGQRIALQRNSPGIVGATPVLAPGQTFEYASGVDIDAPRGSVVGCLHAVRKTKNPEDADDGELFDAFVSKFALLAPRTSAAKERGVTTKQNYHQQFDLGDTMGIIAEALPAAREQRNICMDHALLLLCNEAGHCKMCVYNCNFSPGFQRA